MNWDEDKEQLVENIEEELHLLPSETEKAFVLYEVISNLDESKMPPVMRKGLEDL